VIASVNSVTILEDRLADAAVLVAIVLVLLPVFTATRESTLIALRVDPNLKKADATRQIVLTGAVGLFTLVTFLAGLPLWLDVLCALSPTSAAGVTRSLFAIAWLLLLGLLWWQGSLICRACKLRNEAEA
jgi:protein-S-isoprenylcysteine O-methyltransferase Ste14